MLWQSVFGDETILKQMLCCEKIKENHMKDIKTIRKAVATMANQLHKLGNNVEWNGESKKVEEMESANRK